MARERESISSSPHYHYIPLFSHIPSMLTSSGKGWQGVRALNKTLFSRPSIPLSLPLPHSFLIDCLLLPPSSLWRCVHQHLEKQGRSVTTGAHSLPPVSLPLLSIARSLSLSLSCSLSLSLSHTPSLCLALALCICVCRGGSQIAQWGDVGSWLWNELTKRTWNYYQAYQGDNGSISFSCL